MVLGMTRVLAALYTPIDGEWAKWNAQAILQLGKLFDLSPHSMLYGMGSSFLPNQSWLNPGALVLGLPLSDTATSILSYLVYAVELAGSIIVLARALGALWAVATVAAQ